MDIDKLSKALVLGVATIEKWWGVYNGAAEKGVEDCPYCQAYFCSTCPIGVLVGPSGCRATPYRKWVEHQAYRHRIFNNMHVRTVRCKECKRLVLNEIIFLIKVVGITLKNLEKAIKDICIHRMKNDGASGTARNEV